MAELLPASANIVIVGAGAIGCSIAMHLARAGVQDIVVLEKNAITHGSTWHAAGLIGQYRSAEDLTRLMQASVKVYDEIQAETPIDWHAVGSLRIASSPERLAEFAAAAPIAKQFGIDFSLIDAAEAQLRFPLDIRATRRLVHSLASTGAVPTRRLFGRSGSPAGRLCMRFG